jgi:hypothetical protein
MQQAEFIFHGELGDFLPRDRAAVPIKLEFEDHQSIKHLFESLGIPHCEVAHILVDGEPVDFSYRPLTGERVELFPFTPAEREQMSGPDGMRFVLDMHLGKLARYLRLLGFDAAYRNYFEDAELAETSLLERRILLTRDRRLLMRKQVVQGSCIRALDPPIQLVELMRRFNLKGKVSPFQRCSHCNSLLAPVSKEAIWERLEPLTRRYYDEFHICPSCQRIYWKGSHYERMLAWIQVQIED